MEGRRQWGKGQNDHLTILVVEIREKTCDSFEGDVAGNLQLVKVFLILIKFKVIEKKYSLFMDDFDVQFFWQVNLYHDRTISKVCHDTVLRCKNGNIY